MHDSSGHRAVRRGFVLLALILLVPPSTAAGEKHREKFVLYVDAGALFPGSSDGTEYGSGFQAGGGIGLPLATQERLSFELVGRLAGYRVPISFSSYLRRQSESGAIATLAFKVRHEAGDWLRPYGIFGASAADLASAVLVGVGADIAVDRSGIRLFYVEIAYLGLDLLGNVVCMSAGLRLG